MSALVKKRIPAFMLTIAMVFSLFTMPVFATNVTDAISGTLNGYYGAANNFVIEDTEHLAAVSAAGGDLKNYVLPSKTASTNSFTVLNALMVGDMESAKTAAGGLVSSGTLQSAYYAYGDAFNMIAIEAYNRSAAKLGGTYSEIPYSTAGAISSFLSYSNSTTGAFGYNDWNTGAFVADPDTTGLALIALSLYKNDGAAVVDNAIAGALSYLKDSQQDNGGYVSPYSGNNASSVGVVISGLIAVGENPVGVSWTKNGKTPVDALLSFYDTSGGFKSPAGTVDKYSTKDGLLALADLNNGTSFYGNLECNEDEFISINMSVIDASGVYSSRDVTLCKGGASAADTLEDAISRVCGNTAAFDDYACFDGSTSIVNKDISGFNGSESIVAVHKTYNKVAYFQDANTTSMGICKTDIAFGGTAELTLMLVDDFGNLVGAPVSGGAIHYTGGFYYDALTNSSGKVSITPVNNTTVVSVGGLTADVAVLPATINMMQGSTQTVTLNFRIEGKDGNILHIPNLSVGNSGTKVLTVEDAFLAALDQANITNYTYSNGFVSMIGGDGGDSDSAWMYSIERITGFPSGMAVQPVENGDVITFYYGNWKYLSANTSMTVSQNSDKSVKLTFTDTYSSPISGASVEWNNEDMGLIDANGEITIPAAKAAPGTYPVQISRTDSNGVPTVVRLAPNTTVTITDAGAGVDNPGATDPQTVYFSVRGPYGDLLSKKSYTWFKGITVLDLVRACGLSYELDNAGTYVKKIGSYGEFDLGANSGWLFKVNGDEKILTSVSKTKLNANDYAVFFYTSDYTKEAGSTSWGGGQVANSASMSVAAKKDKNGVASATISANGSELSKFITDIKNLGDEKSSQAVVNVAMPTDSKSISLTMPRKLFKAFDGLKNTSLELRSDFGYLKFDAKAAAAISAASKDSDNIVFSFVPVDYGKYPAADINITINDEPFNSFNGGTLKVGIYHTPINGEDTKKFSIVRVTDDGEEGIKSAAYNDNRKSVEFTTSSLSIYAIVYDEQASTEGFGDIAGHWANEFIAKLYSKGLIFGRDEKTFAPDEPITRAEFLALLFRISGDESPSADDRFKDVSASDWFSKVVVWGVEKGIAEGMGDGTFSPNAHITRQDMSVMLARYGKAVGASMPAGDSSNQFADQSQISEYAADAVNSMKAAEIISGKPGNIFAPLDKATRGETCKIVCLFLELK